MVVGCLALAACAETEQPGEGAGPVDPAGRTSPVDLVEMDPVDLIGTWAVVDPGDGAAAGAAAGDRIVRIASWELRVWRECGTVLGGWRANPGGGFVAHVAGGGGGCTSPSDLDVDWLHQSRYVQPDGEAMVLLDAEGAPTVRLLPDAEPPTTPDLAPSELAPPEVTEQARRMLAPAAPLPPELTPAGEAELTGRWAPMEGPAPAYLELVPDGQWHGSDGCNDLAGRWAAGPADSDLLAVVGASTQEGCDNSPVGEWLAGAARAGLAGGELVLLDVEGTELGRLRPQ